MLGQGRVGYRMITAHMATFPPRASIVRRTVNSLINQVDKVFIYFNQYDECSVPSWAKDDDRIVWECSESSGYGDLGDVGKFYFSSKEMKSRFGISGYVFTCDDDIIYPDWYVSRTKVKLDDSADKGVIFSYHGSKLPRRCTNYHPQKKQFPVKGTVPMLTHVHVAGTGCMAYSHSLFCPSLEIFKHTNMSDIYVAEWAKKNNVSLYVLPHKKGDFRVADVKETIWNSTSKHDGSDMDRSREINKLVSGIRWESLSRPQL